MRKFTTVFGIVIISFAFMQCNQRQSSKSSSSSNEVPVATAHAWQDSLSKSQFTIYQNFDGQYLILSDIEKKLSQSNQYLRLFFGRSGNEYRLISVVCQGVLTPGEFNNDYSTLEFFNGSGWSNTEYDSLNLWLDNFKYSLPSASVVLPYSMIIPNEDFSGIEAYIQNDKIYISFGLDGNNIEMLLGSENITNYKLQSPNERYYNNVIPCPTICGVNDPS